MKTVFIGGSRRISRLNEKIREKLDKIITRSLRVFVGDASGADKAVQKYLNEKGYRDVTVFCAGSSCRNNLGRWQTRHISVNQSRKDYRFYMAKDLEMAKEADVGFMIWDFESSGTISNALELLEMGKKVIVYVGPARRFETLRSMDDLQNLLNDCPAGTVKVFDQKFNLSNRLREKPPVQLELFPG
jgi:hypothetical protein